MDGGHSVRYGLFCHILPPKSPVTNCKINIFSPKVVTQRRNLRKHMEKHTREGLVNSIKDDDKSFAKPWNNFFGYDDSQTL